MGDIRSNSSPISIHLFEECHVIVAIEELVVALFSFDSFEAGVLQNDDDSFLRILFLGFLEAILLGFLRGYVSHGDGAGTDRFYDVRPRGADLSYNAPTFPFIRLCT